MSPGEWWQQIYVVGHVLAQTLFYRPYYFKKQSRIRFKCIPKQGMPFSWIWPHFQPAKEKLEWPNDVWMLRRKISVLPIIACITQPLIPLYIPSVHPPVYSLCSFPRLFPLFIPPFIPSVHSPVYSLCSSPRLFPVYSPVYSLSSPPPVYSLCSSPRLFPRSFPRLFPLFIPVYSLCSFPCLFPLFIPPFIPPVYSRLFPLFIPVYSLCSFPRLFPLFIPFIPSVHSPVYSSCLFAFIPSVHSPVYSPCLFPFIPSVHSPVYFRLFPVHSPCLFPHLFQIANPHYFKHFPQQREFDWLYDNSLSLAGPSGLARCPRTRWPDSRSWDYTPESSHAGPPPPSSLMAEATRERGRTSRPPVTNGCADHAHRNTRCHCGGTPVSTIWNCLLPIIKY